jgi:hypothetical protein
MMLKRADKCKAVVTAPHFAFPVRLSIMGKRQQKKNTRTDPMSSK